MVHDSTKTQSHLLALFGVKNHIVCSSPSADVVKFRLQNDTPRAAANSDIVMSSTYFQYEQREEANFKPFIINKKSIGPSLVSEGYQHVLGANWRRSALV